jgi:hypothetical protein
MMDVYLTFERRRQRAEPVMCCRDCGEKLCSVEDGDELDVLVSIARDHVKKCSDIEDESCAS